MASTETEKLDGAVTGEVRLLIDGELTEAESGKRFDNINPATEDGARPGRRRVGGRHGEGHRGGTPRLRRDRLVHEPRVPAALPRATAGGDRERSEEYRAELVAEVGTPIILTYGPQLDAPLEDGLLWPAQFIDQFEWERKLPDGTRSVAMRRGRS